MLRKVAEYALIPESVSFESNLFDDLFFDSLSFAALLADIEEQFSVFFDIAEMEQCLHAGRLAALTEFKVRENDKKLTSKHG